MISATGVVTGTYSETAEGVFYYKLVLKDVAGVVVASGTSSASYTLKASDEGAHTWTVVATDGVGWTSSGSVSTKYDITAPGIEGQS